MLYKNLGSTDLKISAIGQGTIGAGSHASATPETIRRRKDVIRLGIDLGITFLDTGEDYEDSHAEEILGEAVSGLRDRVFISSKFKPANNSFTGVTKAAESSLKRLRTDYIDLYQLQWPNPSIPLSETIEALLRLMKQGKIRYAGVSNLNLAQLREANELSNGRIVSIQTEYNLFNREIENWLLPHSEKAGITVIAYSPFSRWNLSFKEKEREVILRLEKKYNATLSQIILNWVISHKTVITLMQTMSIVHIRENAGAVYFVMDNEDIEDINKSFTSKPIHVPTNRIRVLNYDADETHCIYTTLGEAIDNPMNIQPAPAVLAEELKKGEMLRPVELIPTADTSGNFDYELVHGRMRYWAWVIAYEGKRPIPALVRE